MSLMVITTCDPRIPINDQWHTGKLGLTWLEQYYPSFYDLEYQLYMIDLYAPENYTILGRTAELSYSFLPEVDGDFLLGVNAIKTFQDIDIMEGPTCWSDDPRCVMDENTFFLQTETIENPEDDCIQRWRIVWD
jgi:hypothetical protein